MPSLTARINRWFVLLLIASCGLPVFGAMAASNAVTLPTPLEAYHDTTTEPLWNLLVERVRADPFNLVATVIFVLAIVHTFMAGRFRKLAHDLQHRHEADVKARKARNEKTNGLPDKKEVSFAAEMLHFFGEVEVIFGLWIVPLILAMIFMFNWHTVENYVSHSVNFTEPMFVVVIMTIAATRPVMRLSEQCLSALARLGKGTPAAWWVAILTAGPLLGSFITEPAAMTICALLLAKKFYELQPSLTLRYATIGLLFVNISVGGTLTHFAAPPVLMVAAKWHWGLSYMMNNFGWKAVVGILISNAVYFLVFRRELCGLNESRPRVRAATPADETPDWDEADYPVPVWVTVVHVFFLAWTVFTAHTPSLFIGGFLFFLAFVGATVHHQEDIRLKPALLVGFFLAGLVVHGTLQQWWIAPVLERLGEVPLMIGSTVLTSFNDNAAITYLATLVPNFGEALKYAVVAGAVTGGGLTVIANAPNPAGQSILQRFFPGGVSPLKLLISALLPTVIVGLCFMLIPA